MRRPIVFMLKILFTITIYIVLIWFKMSGLTLFRTIHFYWILCVCVQRRSRPKTICTAKWRWPFFFVSVVVRFFLLRIVLCIDPFNKIIVRGKQYRHQKGTPVAYLINIVLFSSFFFCFFACCYVLFCISTVVTAIVADWSGVVSMKNAELKIQCTRRLNR